MANIVWLSYDPNSPPKGYWCYGWLEETLGDGVTSFTDLPPGEGAVVVVCVPPEFPVTYVPELNSSLASLPWVTLVIASDEQGRFPVEELAPHPNLKLWVMTPHFENHSYPAGTQFLGEGYPQDARELISNKWQTERTLKASFSGQITHVRRQEMVNCLNRYATINQTAGFTQGLSREDYYAMLARSKAVLAPSGPVTLDSFRAYEALEAGCVPILDLVCPVSQDGMQYWNAVLGVDHPLPTVEHWSEAIPIIDYITRNWPKLHIRTFAWWQLYKRDLKHRLLGTSEKLTILMPTSVIPSHPSTHKIEAVIESVRFHHPDADILLMCDGVRPEQAHRQFQYNGYLQELLYKCNFVWHNVYPIVFETFLHQANMTRIALDLVHTPLIMFVEHDIQMTTDMFIDWEAIIRLVESREVDVVKFSFEGVGIHPEHEHMAIDKETVMLQGCPVRRNVQWSQRPHVATAQYYRRIIRHHFPPANRTMIEDRMHSVAQDYPEYHVLATYLPLTGSAMRCFHIDGREGDEKYGMDYGD